MLTSHVAPALALLPFVAAPASPAATGVEIRGSQFSVSGVPTYTAPAGFATANPNLAGTPLNVRAAVQAIFDDVGKPDLFRVAI